MGIASTEPLVAAEPRTSRRPFWVSRLLTPTLCDLFFLMVVALMFLTSGTGWSRLLWDGDTGLHIAIGNFILDHHTVPTTDPFSFTQPNAPWLAVEWGAGALFAALNGAWGLKGVVFLCGILIAALVTVLLRSALSNRSDTFLAIVLVLLANNALALHYHARPHLFTLLFLALAAWIVNRDRVDRTRWIWFLPVLTVLWANLHPGFVILFAYLALVIAGCGLEWVLGGDDPARSRASALRYTGLATACAAASLLNPFGYKLHLEILSYFGASGMTDLVQEFQAPTFRSDPQRVYMLFLFLGLGVCGLLIRKKRFSDALPILALAYASLISIRHSTIFIVIALPIVARELSGYWEAWVATKRRNSTAAIIGQISTQRRPALMRNSIWPLAAMLALFCFGPASRWPSGFDETLFPVKLIQRHAPELASERLFTPEQWADYLLYLNYPRQRIYYNDSFMYGERMFRKVADLLEGRPHWRESLDEYRVALVLCSSESPLASVLGSAPDWSLADRDAKACLYRRVASK
jgi:hypothetical protein